MNSTMNRKSLHFLITLVVATLSFGMVACSDDDNVFQEQYGYVQFKVCKRTSAGASLVSATRTELLDRLSDAYKIMIVLQSDGSTISQTLLLNAYNSENAEYGLRSDKLQLLAGDYTIIGYYLYDKLDNQLLSGTVEDNGFTIVAGGLVVKDVPVDAAPRGMVSFKLVKKFVKDTTTRAEAEDSYPFSNIRVVDITVKNTFTQELTTFKKIRVEYTEDFKNGSADETLYPGQNAETSYSICDTVVWLKAGTYKISSYTTYSDKKAKTILETAVVDGEDTFVVEDNVETEDVEVPIALNETAEYIKDYLALKEIWDAMGGPEWRYAGESEVPGCNWNFNKDLDLWGDQPGVDLDNNGRVVTLSLAGMGAKGDVPDAIGQLTELVILSFGTHSDLLGGHLFDNVSANMSDEQKLAMRYDYEKNFLARDFREGLSEMWQKTINLDKNEKPILNSRISLKNIQFGDLTNGITGISKAIMRLTNLQQMYIANAPVTSEGFLKEIKEDSPFYAEKDELSWGNLEALVDLEIYNCPNLTSLPMEMIASLPELQQLNVACCKGISGSQLKADWETLIEGACGEKIQILYMGYNNLVEFPEHDKLKKMKNLGMLDCASNKIEKVNPFGKDISLAKIYLDNNKITEIKPAEDGYFCGFSQLESFSCSNNKMKVFPDIFNAKSVYIAQSIDFSENEISSFENGEDFRGVNVNQVDLTGNRLETFPSILFKKNSPITYLILAGNGMKEIPDGSMKGDNAYMLMALDLTYNKLTKLSDDFYPTRLPYMTGLDLSYNMFSEFPYAPLNITSLQRFFIRHQRDEKGNRCLREWPTGIYTCPSLAYFCIGSNDLRKIEDTISPYIYYLEVADNPNISLDVSGVCAYISAGYYMLIYDKTQDIRGCSYLDIEN